MSEEADVAVVVVVGGMQVNGDTVVGTDVTDVVAFISAMKESKIISGRRGGIVAVDEMTEEDATDAALYVCWGEEDGADVVVGIVIVIGGSISRLCLPRSVLAILLRKPVLLFPSSSFLLFLLVAAAAAAAAFPCSAAALLSPFHSAIVHPSLKCAATCVSRTSHVLSNTPQKPHVQFSTSILTFLSLRQKSRISSHSVASWKFLTCWRR